MKNHLRYTLVMVATWCVFWLIGLPHYYQQYPTAALAVVSVLLQLALCLLAIVLLARGRPERRRARAWWLAFYAVVPFALLDTLYCGLYLGRGGAYLVEYWYLTVFYLTPWLTFPPTAALLARASAATPPPRAPAR
jgi:hypothetical protein